MNNISPTNVTDGHECQHNNLLLFMIISGYSRQFALNKNKLYSLCFEHETCSPPVGAKGNDHKPLARWPRAVAISREKQCIHPAGQHEHSKCEISVDPCLSVGENHQRAISSSTWVSRERTRLYPLTNDLYILPRIFTNSHGCTHCKRAWSAMPNL